MARLWFWLVGVTLFVLTFTYQGYMEPTSFGAKRVATARQRVIEMAAAHQKIIEEAEMSTISSVLRTALFPVSRGIGPRD